MTRAYRRGGRAETPDLDLDTHENLSRTLSAMAQQAVGIRRMLKQATGRGSRPSQAAIALVEAIGHLQEVLLTELDATYGDAAPPMVRTRYVGQSSQ